METIIKSLKYLPKIGTAISYAVLLIVSMVLFFGRTFQKLRIAPLLAEFPDFYTHVSNFSLTLILFVTIGYIGLLIGLTLKHITVIGILFGLTNLIFEFFIPILNTPDKTDAVYGLFGVFLGFIFLFITKKWGLKKNEF